MIMYSYRGVKLRAVRQINKSNHLSGLNPFRAPLRLLKRIICVPGGTIIYFYFIAKGERVATP